MINAEIAGARNIGMKDASGRNLRELQVIITEDDAVAFRIGQIVKIVPLSELTEDAIESALRGEGSPWDS